MIRLIYVSHATVPFSTADLDALLEMSRRNNAARDVTGMLIYRDGDFLQILEGPERAVRQTFVHIVADPRHSGLIVLDDTPVSTREFADWWMGFKRIDDDNVPPGFVDFFSRSFDLASMTARGSEALLFLRSFRRDA
jgi:hypothetical protein